MWILVVLLLAPVNGAIFVPAATYPSRDACLRAQAAFNHSLGTHHIGVRTACVPSTVHP